MDTEFQQNTTQGCSRRSSDERSGEYLGDTRESLLDWFPKGDIGEELIWIMLFMINKNNAFKLE